MATTTTTARKINSRADALNSYHVTEEQLSRCTMVENASTGEVFYLVDSMSNPGVTYRIAYSRELKALQCLPHNGPACPASVDGIGCYHKRAALCAHAIYRLEQSNRARAEAATIEADPAVQEEQAEVSAAQEAERASRYHDGPFCEDSNCPCHDDNDNYHEYVIHPLYEGLLTVTEANNIYYGRQ